MARDKTLETVRPSKQQSQGIGFHAGNSARLPECWHSQDFKAALRSSRTSLDHPLARFNNRMARTQQLRNCIGSLGISLKEPFASIVA